MVTSGLALPTPDTVEAEKGSSGVQSGKMEDQEAGESVLLLNHSKEAEPPTGVAACGARSTIQAGTTCPRMVPERTGRSTVAPTFHFKNVTQIIPVGR